MIGKKINTLKKIIGNRLADRGLYAPGHRKGLCILMYHGIDRTEDTRFNERFFSVQHFEEHIAYLSQHTHILNDHEFATKALHPDKLNVLLTFDDGYANNYRYALPVLEKYQAHAYFFITGMAGNRTPVLWADAVDIVAANAADGSTLELDGHKFILHGRKFTSGEGVGLKSYVKASTRADYAQKQALTEQLLGLYDFTKQKSLEDYWQLMTDAEIVDASKSSCITIGSHGYYHHNLGSLAHADAVAEVGRSKKYLEQLVQREVRSIAFPDGSYTEQLNDDLMALGFDRQFLVSYRQEDDRKRSYTYDRLGLYPSMGNAHRILYKIMRG